MRRRALIVLLISFLLTVFASCDSGETEFVVGDFSSNVSFSCSDISYIGELRFISSNNISITVNSPELIKGIELVYDGNKTYINYDNLTVSVEDIAVGSNAFIPLFTALEKLSVANVKIKNEGIDTVALSDASDMLLTVSFDDAKIASIESLGITYNFEYN